MLQRKKLQHAPPLQPLPAAPPRTTMQHAATVTDVCCVRGRARAATTTQLRMPHTTAPACTAAALQRACWQWQQAASQHPTKAGRAQPCCCGPWRLKWCWPQTGALLRLTPAHHNPSRACLPSNVLPHNTSLPALLARQQPSTLLLAPHARSTTKGHRCCLSGVSPAHAPACLTHATNPRQQTGTRVRAPPAAG